MKDARCKCNGCGGWMKYKPTPKTPKTRQKKPFAQYCTDCCKMEDGLVSLFG